MRFSNWKVKRGLVLQKYCDKNEKRTRRMKENVRTRISLETTWRRGLKNMSNERFKRKNFKTMINARFGRAHAERCAWATAFRNEMDKQIRFKKVEWSFTGD